MASHDGDDFSEAEVIRVHHHIELVECCRPGDHGSDGAIGKLPELSGVKCTPLGLRLGDELDDLALAVGGDGVETFHFRRAVPSECCNTFLVEAHPDVDVDVTIVLAIGNMDLSDAHVIEPLACLH